MVGDPERHGIPVGAEEPVAPHGHRQRTGSPVMMVHAAAAEGPAPALRDGPLFSRLAGQTRRALHRRGQMGRLVSAAGGRGVCRRLERAPCRPNTLLVALAFVLGHRTKDADEEPASLSVKDISPEQ